MDAQPLNTTPGACAATHRGQSRGSHPRALTVSAHSLTTPGPSRCRSGTCVPPVARTGALVGTPLPSRPVAGPDLRQSLRLGAPMTLRTANRARLTPGGTCTRCHSAWRAWAAVGSTRTMCGTSVPVSRTSWPGCWRSGPRSTPRCAGCAGVRKPGTGPGPCRRCQFSVSGSFGPPAARRPCRSRSAVFVPGVPGRAGSRGSGLDAKKRVRNINPSGFTLPTHPGTTPETPTAESTCQESERVVV